MRGSAALQPRRLLSPAFRPFRPREPTMIVAISSFEIHLPQARSLKEKRRVVKSLTDRIHHRYRVSIAETDHHDLHQRAGFGLAAVFTRQHEAESALETIRDLLETVPEAYLTRWEPDLIDGEIGR